MKVVIIEDEKPAAEKLQKALKLVNTAIRVEAILGTVSASVEWLKNHPLPELIFLDIELTDGLSFKIFDQISISCPVIFTTAYDEYWQEVFEYNSIDYLLKPFKEEKLKIALEKYNKLKNHFSSHVLQLWQTEQKNNPSSFKKRFLVKKGHDYLAIKTENIAYFYAAHKLICLVDSTGQKYLLDKSLVDVEKELDSRQFYRLNRKYIANINAIKKIKSHSKSKLLIDLEPAVNDEIIISQECVASFKEWISQ